MTGSPLASEKTLGRGSIYARFEDLGYRLTRIREEVSSRTPTPDEAAGLLMSPGIPVIDVLHTSLDEQLKPFEVTRFVMRADPAGLEYTIQVEGWGCANHRQLPWSGVSRGVRRNQVFAQPDPAST